MERSEERGYGLTLIAELNLNGIKGVQAPSLDAWSTAASMRSMYNGAVATASVMTGSMERLQRCRYSATSGRQPP